MSSFILIFYLLTTNLFAQGIEKHISLQAPYVIDGLEVGLGLITPNDITDENLIEASPLLESLEPYLDNDLLTRLKTNLGSRRFISSKDLKEYNLTTHFDSSLLNLEIIIPTALRRKTSIDLMGAAHSIEKSVYLPSKYSGWLNVNLTDNYLRSDKQNSNDFTSHFQAIQNLRGLVFEENISYRNSEAKDWTLGDVKLIKDSKSKLIRYTLGDLSYPTRGFQLASVGGGISATKEFSISPRTVTHTLDKTTLTLKRPSQVEIFLNGSQLENMKLPPGPVDLSNYPFASGRNEVLIKITDDQGHIETINYSTLFHSQILRPNYSEFNYSLEFPQITEGMHRKYFKNDPKISAFYNQGLTQSFTSGINLQGDEKTKLAGLENFWLNGLGLWTLELAGSSTSQNQGAAERIEYQSLERWTDKEAPFLFRTSFEMRSASFFQVGVFSNDLKRTLDLYASTRLPWRGSIGSGFSRRDYRTKENQLTGRLDYSQNIGRSWQWGANYNQDFSGLREKKIYITLSWSPPQSSVGSFNNYESTTQNYSTQWRYQALQGIKNLTAVAAAARSERDEKINIQTDYSSPLFEAKLAHQNLRSRIDDHTENSGQANLRFATVWTTKNISLSRPINDAFAIIDATPRPLKYEIPIGAFSNFNGGTINKYGPAVVTNIQPYSESNLALDVRDLPVGQVSDKEVFTVIPNYKSGVDVLIEIQTRTSVAAEIMNEEKLKFSLQTGRIFNEKNIEVASFFSNREGRIYIDDIKSGTYRLELDDNRYEPISITIPSSTNGNLIQLGTLLIPRAK